MKNPVPAGLINPASGGGSGEFWVTPADLAAAAQRTRTGAHTTHEQLMLLRNYVLGLQEFWSGSAQAQFSELMHDFDVYANMLNDALVDIASGMDGNKVNYEASELANINNLVSVELPKVNF